MRVSSCVGVANRPQATGGFAGAASRVMCAAPRRETRGMVSGAEEAGPASPPLLPVLRAPRARTRPVGPIA